MDQIQREKIAEKLKKIKALAERGVGGEKETAMRMYEELKARYEIEDEEIMLDTVTLHWFSYSNDLEEDLLTQIFFKVTGSATYRRYIYTEQIPIMPVYGECICSGLLCEGCETYKLTGEQRTGCKLCGFGIMYDPDRFIRLEKIEPNVVKFAFTSKKNGGLGYREICKFLNEKCGMKIGIPDTEEGFYQKRAKAYAERMGGATGASKETKEAKVEKE